MSNAEGSEPTRIGVAEKFFGVKTIQVEGESPTKVDFEKPVAIRVRSNLEEIQLEPIVKPGWAVEFGRDVFGTYADFEVVSIDTSVLSKVRNRLRWIPPGSFQMGSPPDEPGRFDREVLHSVTITEGFWMFETPCTQRLWTAVMGDNPSYFLDPDRPVERIDWHQALEFPQQLTERLRTPSGNTGLSFQLPTEAQWEYACRAGTSTAIYTGPLEILGDAWASAS